jgi:LPP20 lipoprotein
VRQIFLIIALVASAFANPMWYHNVQKTKANSYVGYGSGVNETDAKQEAFNDITSQISVNVNTSFSQKQKMQDGEIKSSEEFSSSQNSKATLYDYELLKSEYSDGKYFVALQYENIPSVDKFINKIKKSNIKLKNEKQNSYLKNTSMAKKLKKALKKDIAFSLVRKDAKWFVKYKNILQILDKKDFAKFFTTVDNKLMSINTNKRKNILYNEDKFFFKVKSAKGAYASILTVYEDGTVSTLVRNVALKKGKLENIPDKDFETIPEAGLMQRGIETYDLYVLLLSSKKIHLDSFAQADEELIEEEKYKNFDELIEFIDTKEYATLKVVTKPRIY